MLLVVLVGAACKSAPKEVPVSQVDVSKSTEYDQVRPVTIALLPVKAPRADLRTNVRQEIYKLLPERKYSPFRLQEVDAHVDARGRFQAENLDWDATLEVVIDKWTPVGGTNRWAGTGRAVLTHRTGEVLWACDFEDYAFRVPTEAGVTNHAEGAKEIAFFLLGGEPGRSRMPDCAPPPPGP
jgi:hypothetical protein